MEKRAGARLRTTVYYVAVAKDRRLLCLVCESWVLPATGVSEGVKPLRKDSYLSLSEPKGLDGGRKRLKVLCAGSGVANSRRGSARGFL